MDESQKTAQDSLRKHGLEFATLGLLGQAGSGKDLVADYLCEKQGFVKIAFADPMKRFVKKAFGLTLEQLWGGSEERNRPITVNEEWWYNAVASLPGSAFELTNRVLYSGVKVQGYLTLLDWATWLRRNYPTEITPRVILQTLGTEWGRKVDPDMWVRYGHEVVELVKRGHFYTQEGGVRERNPGEVSHYAGAVIPDHRFFNEVEATQKYGFVIKLRRLLHEKKQETVGLAGHQSEAEQKGMPDESFDLVLNMHEFIKETQENFTLIKTVSVAELHAALDAVYEKKAWTSRKMTGKPEVLDLRPS